MLRVRNRCGDISPEIENFHDASVEEVLHKEFNPTLGSKEVNILDPCTRNFIFKLINRLSKRDLPLVYQPGAVF